MKVAINAAGGGNDSGIVNNGLVEKDITLKIANIIKEKLEDNNIETIMLREDDETISYAERIKKLKEKFPNEEDVIVLSNTLNNGGSSGIEIIYPLNSTNTLPSILKDTLEYFNDTTYYQYRWPTDTSKDYYYITRELPGYETIIIRYGYADNEKDNDIIKNNYEEMANSVADALIEYINGKNTYVIKSGDTLYSIAKKYNTTVNEIKNKNNLTSNNLTIGNTLLIPEQTKKEEVSTPSPYTYIVKSGDNLYSIAKKYNTTVDKLKLINNKKNNNLSIGEKLNLYAKYQIKSGDTLYSIAKKNNTTVDKIKTLNNLNINTLTIGKYIYIP